MGTSVLFMQLIGSMGPIDPAICSSSMFYKTILRMLLVSLVELSTGIFVRL
jgi:hypothetical protein